MTNGGVSAGRTSGPTKASLTLNPPQDTNNKREGHGANPPPTYPSSLRVRGRVAPVADPGGGKRPPLTAYATRGRKAQPTKAP